MHLRKIRQLIFYSLPTYPQFFSEICNMYKTTQQADASCVVLFSNFDAYKLSMCVGTERTRHMINNNKNVFMFVTGDDDRWWQLMFMRTQSDGVVSCSQARYWVCNYSVNWWVQVFCIELKILFGGELGKPNEFLTRTCTGRLLHFWWGARQCLVSSKFGSFFLTKEITEKIENLLRVWSF